MKFYVIFQNLSQPDYYNLRSQFPMLPPDVNFLIILAGGHLKITLDGFSYEAQYFNNFRFFAPVLNFNQSLLCPAVEVPSFSLKNSDYLVMYLISLTNSAILGTTILCIVCIKRFLNRNPVNNMHDSNLNNSRPAAAPPAYQPPRSQSAINADQETLGLIRLMARSTH